MSARPNGDAIATAREGLSPWLGVHEAAFFLGLPVVTLRRSLERAARRCDDGAIEARVDGVVARKFGRLWRVRLGGGWLSPSPPRPTR